MEREEFEGQVGTGWWWASAPVVILVVMLLIRAGIGGPRESLESGLIFVAILVVHLWAAHYVYRSKRSRTALIQRLQSGAINSSELETSVRIYWVVSAFMFDLRRFPGEVVAEGSSKLRACFEATLFTLLFGALGSPLGPIHAARETYRNFRGGDRKTLREIMDVLGIDYRPDKNGSF